MTKQTISIQKLTELCKKYDEARGRYPESDYEGAAVLAFILDEVKPVVTK